MTIPLQLLHEVSGFKVAIELVSGDVYEGKLVCVEENMNCWLDEVIHTSVIGEKTAMDKAFIRGSGILFVSIPKMFANSSVIPRETGKKAKRLYNAVRVRRIE